MTFLHLLLGEFDWGYFNKPGPEIGYSKIDLEVSFELHCRTANPIAQPLVIKFFIVFT